MKGRLSIRFKLAAFAATGIAAVAMVGGACGPSGDALKIGYLADYSGQLAEFGPAIETGVRLAVTQINAAGGVNGQDVEVVTGDTALDSTTAVTEARRLIDVDGVHAIVGPLASSVTLAVAESVLKDAKVPGISPSATAPTIGDADDGDFLFRTAVSDTAQGQILANNVVEDASRGGASTNVGVIYVNNAYGQGLSETFEEHFDGTATSASYAEDASTFRSELQQVSAGDADALVIIGYAEAETILREAIQDDLFETYYFVDGSRSEELAGQVGVDNVAGSFGTAPGSGSSSSFDAAYNAAYTDPLPQGSPAFVRSAYDATIAIALAAEAVDGELTGEAIRDQLRSVTSAPGRKAEPSASSISDALEHIDGGLDVDYDGVTSVIAWDSKGDVSGGFITVWMYDSSGQPMDVETIEIR